MIKKDTLTAGLKEAAESLVKRQYTAIERALVVFQGETVNTTPVDTGRLRQSLQIGGKDNIYSIDQKGPVLVGVLGTNVEYAKEVEFGTEKRRASRYLQRALKKAEPTINKVIQNTLKL